MDILWAMATAFDFKSRLRAFLVHLAGSVLLALAALALVYGVWYPSPLDKAAGVSVIVLFMLTCDVVLGPLLTFVVYKVGKRSLRFDLAVIVVVQLAAFAYGIYIIAQGRPAWLVFNVDRFDVTLANELDQRHLNETKPEYRFPSWTGPKWVASVNPTDIEKRNQLVMESVEGGPDLPQRPDLFQSLDTETNSIRARAKPLSQLTQFNGASEITEATSQWPHADAWLPLMSRNRSMVVLVNREQARPVAIVDLKPWKDAIEGRISP